MKSELTFCAETVIIDIQTNAVSVFNILENAAPAGFPFIFPRVTFYVLLKREMAEPETFTGTLLVKNNETALISHQISIDFKKKLNNRLTTNIGGLIINSAGKVSFQLLDSNDATLGQWIIEVKSPVPIVTVPIPTSPPSSQSLSPLPPFPSPPALL